MSLTAKQEKFCQKYIELGNASEAYRQSYDAGNMGEASINEEAYRLMQNPVITLRVSELQELSVKRHLVTVDSLTDEYEQIRAAAFTEKQFSPAISAVTGKAKLHGLVSDKPEVSVAVQVNTIQPLDFARRAAFLFKLASKELENGNKRTDDGIQG